MECAAAVHKRTNRLLIYETRLQLRFVPLWSIAKSTKFFDRLNMGAVMHWKWIIIGIVLIFVVTIFRSQTIPGKPTKEFAPSSPTAQLIEAAGMGDTEAVRSLLQEGVDVNTKNEVFGYTALILAARQGHADTVRVLLENGADVNTADRYGSTALRWAEKNGHAEVVNLLKKAGARGSSTLTMQPVLQKEDGR
jgi:hypothetical protein